MLCKIISVVWFFWWGWAERIGLSRMKYFVNAEEKCIYWLSKHSFCFQSLYNGQSWPAPSLPPLPSPCFMLSLQKYENDNPAPFFPNSLGEFLRRGLLQTCGAIPFPESISLNFKSWHSTKALSGSHFCSLSFLLKRGWRDKIKVWKRQQGVRGD